MKPQLLGGAQRCQPLQIVDRAGVDRAGRADDAERLEAALAVRGDPLAERPQVDAKLAVGGDPAQRRGAEAQDLHRLDDALVDFARGIGDQLSRMVAQPVRARLLRARIAGDGQRDQIGHRGAADEQATGQVGHGEQLLAPVDNRALDIDCAVVPAAAIGVHRRGQHFGDDTIGRAGAVHPAEEPGMGVAGAVGQDQLLEFVVYLVEALFLQRDRRVECCTHRVRHRLPHRALPRRPEELDRIVECCMRGCGKTVPVVRIERQFRPLELFVRSRGGRRTMRVVHGFWRFARHRRSQ